MRRFMGIDSLLGYALAVGVVSGVVAYAGAVIAESKERRRAMQRRERKVQGM